MSTDDVVAYLDTAVFPLAADVRTAGAGEGLERAAPAAEN